jgi:hypothetical protein
MRILVCNPDGTFGSTRGRTVVTFPPPTEKLSRSDPDSLLSRSA